MRFAIIAGLTLVALPAFAQGALDKVYACAGITESAQRLACYDSAVAGLKQAESTGGVAVVNREQIEKAEKEAFGLATPTLSALAESARSTAGAASSKKPKALERVSFPVKSVTTGPDGKYRFVMENGQEWRQTDTIRLPAIGKGPWQAEIRKAAIGSYMLKLDDRTAVRVKRAE